MYVLDNGNTFLIFKGHLAKVITVENGKTLADAEGSILRGLRKY